MNNNTPNHIADCMRFKEIVYVDKIVRYLLKNVYHLLKMIIQICGDNFKYLLLFFFELRIRIYTYCIYTIHTKTKSISSKLGFS